MPERQIIFLAPAFVPMGDAQARFLTEMEQEQAAVIAEMSGLIGA